jgi:hypothetical protein
MKSFTVVEARCTKASKQGLLKIFSAHRRGPQHTITQEAIYSERLKFS